MRILTVPERGRVTEPTPGTMRLVPGVTQVDSAEATPGSLPRNGTTEKRSVMPLPSANVTLRAEPGAVMVAPLGVATTR